MEIIQQWQYNGAVHPEMLKDNAFKLCKDIGITAVQSYVPWSNIESKKGVLDFSLYDPLVEKLEKHGIGWVPFLILGPYYATPQWFLKSKESVFLKCLEHYSECTIQSIWNPHLRKYVESFIRCFYEHYQKCPVIKEMLLGISGNWGESIYPVEGGFVDEKHMHQGWWCGDEYALEHFRQSLQEKYKYIKTLNCQWEKDYENFGEINFPDLKNKFNLKHTIHRTGYRFLGWLPREIKSFLKSMVIKSNTDMEINGSQRQWIDFVEWYISSMTQWVEFWLSTIRRYFKDTLIYIVTGGDGHPMMGADFFSQTRLASRYSAGIRVTSLSDCYAESFVLSRSVSSASRFYSSYFETEEAGLHSSEGIAMRIFDAITSSAKGIYFKNFIGHGRDICTGRYHKPATKTSCADIFIKNKHYLLDEKPLIDIAVFYPTTAIILDYHVLVLLKDRCASLREYIDFDFIDENMLNDSALKRYTVFITTDYYFIPTSSKMKIVKWVEEKGGLFICTVKGNNARRKIEKKRKGYILYISGTKTLPSLIGNAVNNADGHYPWCRRSCIKKNLNGIYESICESGLYLYNSGKRQSKVRLESHDIVLPPKSLIKTKGVYAICQS